MTPRLKYPLALLVVSASSLFGQFALLEDFEGYATGNISSQSPHWSFDQADAQVGSSGGNNYLVQGAGANDDHTKFDNGAALIPDGNLGTFFFRAYMTNATHIGVGISPLDAAAASNHWNDGKAIVRFGNNTGSSTATFGYNLGVSGSYSNLTSATNAGAWYNIWVLIDNTANRNYEVHIQSDDDGDFTTQAQYGPTGLNFRQATADGTLESLFFRTAINASEVYIDDLYIDSTSHNLDLPTLAASQPLAVDDAVEVGVGGAIRFNPLANDTGNIDATSVTVVSGPSAGTVSVDAATGEMIYKHTGGVAGVDTVRYEISNPGATAVSQADVDVTISGAVRLENHTVNVPLDPPVVSPGQLAIEDGLPGLTFPSAIAMTSVPGTPEALLVAQLNGAVWYIPDTNDPSPSMHKVLEVTNAISAPMSPGSTDRRILSLTCYPDFATSGNIILNYQGDRSRLPAVGSIPNLDKDGVPNTNIDNELRVSRFTLSAAHIADVVANGMSAAENTAVLNTEYPFINMAEQNQIHSINDCKFGPDGYLYISFGDEGGQPDPHRNGQTITKDYYSSILRIDVDPASTNPKPNPHYTIPAGPLSGGTFPAYTSTTQNPNFRIPPDNPFIHTSLGGTWDGDMNGTDYSSQLTSVRTEIWVLGLRNPFKFHLDTDDGTPTGEVEAWIGDIGYTDREEIDLFTNGDNGGWSYFEGELTPAYGNGSAPGGSTPHKPALWTYNTGSATGNSVIGGIFYRDSALSSLTNTYVFGDYGSGKIFSLTRAGVPTELTALQLGGADIIDFELDESTGDIFVLEYEPSGARVMRITEQTGGPSGYPDKLSETGLFADLSDLSPNPGVVPYTPNLKFWSDDADKSRWFVIKNLTDTIGYSQDGNWTFPEGMVWVKHFDFDLDLQNPGTSIQRLETRLLVRNASGSYGVSYRWNGADADLVANGGEDFPVNFTDATGAAQSFTWQIPSRAQCSTCHTAQGGHALSMNTRQFNLDQIINGQSGNLMELMHAGGYLAGFPGSASGLARHYRPDETAVDLEERVRSYLAVNCAYCHMAGGSAPASFDARAHLTLEQTNLLYGDPISEGTPDETDHIIRPGDKPNSSIWNKINARAAINGTFNGYSQMPPLGTNRFDDEGIALIQEWIENHANVAPTHVGVTAPGLPEGSVVGTSAGTADATDPDVRGGVSDQSQLSYAITGGNPDSYFAIDPLTGEITVTGWLDYEDTTTHVLEVTASDNFAPNPKAAITSVTVNVQDIANEDANANGLPDTWEAFFSLSGVTAAGDGDGDGFTEFFELLSGGDPLSGNSPGGSPLLVDPAGDPAEATYSWRYLNGFELGTDYFLQGSSLLTGWAALVEGVDYQVDSDVADGPGYRRMTIKLLGTQDQYFVRLASP